MTISEATYKHLAREFDLHGTVGLYRQPNDSAHAAVYVVTVAMPVSPEIVADLKEEYRCTVKSLGNGFVNISTSGINARQLCKRLKPYSAWHKNQFNIVAKYFDCAAGRGRTGGVDAPLMIFRQTLVEKLNHYNQLVRERRAKRKSGLDSN